MWNKYMVLIVFLFIGIQSFASHLIGGQMYYKPLGNGRIELTVEIYRDGTNTNTPFDRPAYVTLVGFNNTRKLIDIGTPEVSLLEFNKLDCKETPPNQGYEKGIYTVIIDLASEGINPIPGEGWRFVYRRCCFNADARNIVFPGFNGFSLELEVPENPAINNSPIFDSNPPIIACLGEENVIDAGAKDADGDSLVYFLCPGLSADRDATNGEIADPPYSSFFLDYRNGYSGNNPIQTLNGVNLNPQTGELVFTPVDVLSNYVFSVCVEEYRNGQLIGTYQRIYQVRLVDCNDDIQINFSGVDLTPCIDSVSQFFAGATGGSGGYSYSWNFGTGNPNDVSSEQNPTFIYNTPGNYLVEVTVKDSTGCEATDLIDLGVRDILNINLPNDTLTCFQEPFDIIAVVDPPFNIGAFNFDWRANGQNLNGQADDNVLTLQGNLLQDFLIEVEVNSGAICNSPAIATMNWSVRERNDLEITDVSDVTACVGDEIDIEAFADLPNSNYRWSVIEDPSINGNGENFSFNISTNTATVVVEAINSEACAPEYDTVIISSNPFLEVTAFTDSFYCFNGNVQASAQFSDDANYIWVLNNQDTLRQFFNSDLDTTFDPGVYTLTVIGSPVEELCEGRNIDTLEFTVNDIAGDVDFIANQEKLFAGLPITFLPNPIQNNKYTWRLPNDSIIVSDSVTYLFRDKGEYQVCLSNFDENGCVDTICKTILVIKPPAARIPNAFSPDGDGVNDELKVLGIGIVDLNLKIFNRWGKQVFQSSTIGEGWDGTFKGVDQPEEVYIYAFKAVLIDGQVIEETGNATLIR